MKILQIFGAVVAVHLLAFIFIFASPGCQSGSRNVPTPDATLPRESTPAPAPSFYNASTTPQPVDLGTSSANSSAHPSPTRPGSPNAAAVSPARANEEVAPVTTYTVVKGDSLWSVAKKNRLTVSELARANNLSSGATLKPGKKLIVPVKPGVTAAPKEASPPLANAKPAPGPEKPATTTEGIRHTVQSGESLGVIARRYQVSVGELAAANNITDPSKVRSGQQLVIPGFKSVGPKGNQAAANRSAAGVNGSSTPAPTPTPVAGTDTPPSNAPHFEVNAPPPGQDLDAGLKEPTTEVPTIKVEESTEQAPKN